MFVALFCANAQAKLKIVSDGSEVYRVGIIPDLNVDFGGGGVKKYETVMARVRTGATFVREPLFVSLGADIQMFSRFSPRLGAQLEIMHLWTGFWGQVGFGFDLIHRNVVPNASVGWSLLGAEFQRLPQNQWMTLLKIRIPIGIIFAR